ncbi:MAG: hypothetical protein QM770_06975 [Tepidisphaeraceae bacterium]
MNSGVANIRPESGKSVHGGPIELSGRAYELLDALFDPPRQASSVVPRATRRVVDVIPYRAHEPVQAITFQFATDAVAFAVPSRSYLTELITHGAAAGVSSMWLMQLSALSSFVVDRGRVAMTSV